MTSLLIFKICLVLAHQPAGIVDPLRFKNGTCWPTWLRRHKCIAVPLTMRSTLLANRNTNKPARFALIYYLFWWLHKKTRKSHCYQHTQTLTFQFYLFYSWQFRRWIKFLLKSRLNVARDASAKKATVQHLFRPLEILFLSGFLMANLLWLFPYVWFSFFFSSFFI